VKRVFIALLVVTGLALVAGCDIGGDDRLSKDEFKEKATAIDKRVSDSFDNVFRDINEKDFGTNKPVSEKTKSALAEAANVEKDAVAELSDLKPPEEGQAAVDELVKVAGTQADRLAEAAANPKLTFKELEASFDADDVDKPINELIKLDLWPPQEEGQ
jgi:hypothetical protein